MKNTSRLFGLFWTGFLLSTSASAVSMNFNGMFRFEGDYYSNLALRPDTAKKTYLLGKALVDPTLVIDDHFSLKSQWTMLGSPSFAPSSSAGGNPLGPGQGGYVFGDVATNSLVLNRVWLEWTSDFGVLRIGRMPFTWGYGLMWDSGNRMWDDFQTTLDRVEYRLHLGYVVGGIAYSKMRKLSVLAENNDQQFYTVYLQYNNPEIEVEGGIIYEKQGRNGQDADLTDSGSPPIPHNPYKVSGTGTEPPLSDVTGYPLSNSVVGVYLKKTWGHLSLGGEVSWLTGEAVDFDGDGTRDGLDAYGALVSASYEADKFKIFLETVFATGDTDFNDKKLNGFVLLNRNRRPGIILGRELLGPYLRDDVQQGGLVYYGDPNSFSGVLYFRPGIRVDWSRAWSTGLEVIIARKATGRGSEEKHLGIEVDLGADYAIYRNMNLGLTAGYLIPGLGLRVVNPVGAFALRVSAGLTF